MASVTGPVYVPAPNPVIARPGLFQVATGPLALPDHARIGGLQYQIAVCDLPACYEVECLADHNEKTLTGEVTLIEGDPFIVYSSVLCSPVGMDDAQLRSYLFNKLVAGEQAIVEQVFSLQSCAQAPGLSDNAAVEDVTPTPGTAIDLTRAISLLESAFYAANGLPGTIHVPAALGIYLAYMHLVEKDGRGIWRTPMGSAISIGNYAGADPDGVAPAADETWVYMTGQVAIYRTADSDLFVTTRAETLNRATNQVTAVMEREYVVTFDCLVLGVQVEITGVVA